MLNSNSNRKPYAFAAMSIRIYLTDVVQWQSEGKLTRRRINLWYPLDFVCIAIFKIRISCRRKKM